MNDGKKIICEYITKSEPNNTLCYSNELIQNIQNSLITGFDTSSIDNGEDFITTVGEITSTITTTKNQKNKENDNVTTIDLGKCEDKLKEKYNISNNDSLYLLKIDFFTESLLKLEYEVYYNFSINNLTKLDLTFCKGIQIDISIPKDIPFSDLDKFNQSSGLYNDICYTSTSDTGIDISIQERRNEYKNNNMSICEEICVFSQ